MIKFRGLNAVKLDLPTYMMIHDTVNVSRIKKDTAVEARGKPLPPAVLTVRDKDGMIQRGYVIEAITSHKRALGVIRGYKYQSKWDGYDNKEITWDPAANISKAKQMLDDNKKHGLGETKVKRKRKD